LYWRESTASQIGRTRRSGMPPASPNLLAMPSRNLGLGFCGVGLRRAAGGEDEEEEKGEARRRAREERVYRVRDVTARVGTWRMARSEERLRLLRGRWLRDGRCEIVKLRSLEAAAAVTLS
jgi:hypothetical protein